MKLKRIPHGLVLSIAALLVLAPLSILTGQTQAPQTAPNPQASQAQPPAKAPQAPRGTTPAARRAPPKPPAPLTLRQVLESLSQTKNSRRVEDTISKAGVQFQTSPAVVDILKQYGASDKLISMIPAPPPPPPPPPAPKMARPLTVVCEPKDCTVIVNDRFQGSTTDNRKTVSGFNTGEATIRIFADGYEQLARRVVLEEGKPLEEKFILNRSTQAREEAARALLLKAVIRLGGLDGLVEMGDVDGTGMMEWTTSTGSTERWSVTFSKRPGKNLSTTFKTQDGQCTASIVALTAKKECKGSLRNGGDKIAEQATSLFLSYQVQDVIDTLLRRPLIASETEVNRVDSVDAKDSYSLIVGSDGLPTDLVYRVAGSDAPIRVQYSNYMNLGKGWAPGKVSIGRVNAAPAWIFTFMNVKSNRGGRG